MRQVLIILWLSSGLVPASPGTQERASEITGHVRFEGTYKPRTLNAQIDADKHGGPGRGEKDVFDESTVLGPNQELANVLVRVKGPFAVKFEAPKESIEIEMRAYAFRPRVAVVQVGQALKMKNGDLDNLNVHGKAVRNKEFNVGMVKGASHEIKFTEREIGILVRHDCCPWQVAWIHVIEHPYFAVTGKDGAFKIGNLPAGTYELEAWHEKYGVQTGKVTVEAQESKTQDFVFKGGAKPDSAK